MSEPVVAPRELTRAVRVGDEWFVAGINGILESQATIDFSFLGEGSYTAEFFTDAEGAKTVEKQTKTFCKCAKTLRV